MLYDSVCKGLGVVKIIDAERRMVVGQGLGEEGIRNEDPPAHLTFKGHRVSVLKDEKSSMDGWQCW